VQLSSRQVAIDRNAHRVRSCVNLPQHDAVLGRTGADERKMLRVPAINRDRQHHRFTTGGIPGTLIASCRDRRNHFAASRQLKSCLGDRGRALYRIGRPLCD
jgi:hypothetical protein